MIGLRKMAMAALLLTVPGAASAQVDCAAARRDFSEASENIQTRLRPYWRCVGQSNGGDDCMLEFKQVERAHKRFDDAVLSIRLQCRADRLPRMGDSN
jgi:hypothetical protein